MKAYGKGQNLTPATPKSLNRSSPKFAQVITSGNLPPWRILCRSDKGFHFHTCTTSHIKLFSQLFLGVLNPANSQHATMDNGHWRKIRQKTWFRARMCPFGVAKSKINIYAPFSASKPPFWDLISTVLWNFCPKTALTLDDLRVNGP